MKHRDLFEEVVVADVSQDPVFKRIQDEIAEMIKIVFSYECLPNEQAKSCFLLCCLFRESENLPIEMLVSSGIGLELFKGIALYLKEETAYKHWLTHSNVVPCC